MVLSCRNRGIGCNGCACNQRITWPEEMVFSTRIPAGKAAAGIFRDPWGKPPADIPVITEQCRGSTRKGHKGERVSSAAGQVGTAISAARSCRCVVGVAKAWSEATQGVEKVDAIAAVVSALVKEQTAMRAAIAMKLKMMSTMDKIYQMSAMGGTATGKPKP